MKIDGSVAIVTGASRGIGRAVARSLHRHGAAVGLVARSESDLVELADELGDRTTVAVADVSVRQDVISAFADISERLGPIDILVNNAGIGAYASMLDETPDIYERLMRVNYLGTVYPTLAVLESMVSRRRGHIVNVASIAGRVGAPFEAAYSASKFAVVGMSEALAAEVHPMGISVSLVNPGPVATEFTEARGVPFQRSVPKPSRPEIIADAVLAAIERNRFEQIIPSWLRVGPMARAMVPSLYRKGLIRDSAVAAKELAERHKKAPS